MADLLLKADSEVEEIVAGIKVHRDKIVSTSDEGKLLEEISQFRTSLKQLPSPTLIKNERVNESVRAVIGHANFLNYIRNVYLKSNNQTLRFEAAYLFSEISAESDLLPEVSTDLFDVLVAAFASEEESNRRNAIDAILATTIECNSSDDLNDKNIGYLIEKNIIPVLLNRVFVPSDPLAAKACLLIARLASDRFFAQISASLPFVISCLNFNENEVIAAAAGALAALGNGSDTQIEAVISDSNVPTRLAELLLNPVEDILQPVLRTVGNIITGDDFQTQTMINVGVVSNLLWLLDHSNKKISREACWTISNVAGSQWQIQEVINAAIVPKVIVLLKTKKDEEQLHTDAAWVIWNLLSGGRDDQVDYVISEGGKEAICDVWRGMNHISLKVTDIKRLLKNSLDYLVKAAKASNTERRNRIHGKLKAKVLDESADDEAIWPMDLIDFVREA